MTIQKRKIKDIDRVQRAVNLAGVPQGCVYHDSRGRHFCRSRIKWSKRVSIPCSVSPPGYSGRWGEKRRREWMKVHGVVDDGVGGGV